MSQIQRPYYGLHQIDTGKYAGKDELMYTDGTPFEGLYHELPNGQLFSGTIPSVKSKELIKKIIDVSQDVIKYNNLRNTRFIVHKSPVQIYPEITNDDIQNGYIERFFIQRRNNPLNTIMEIDYDQFNNIGSRDGNINDVIWNSIFIKWYISNLIPEIISSLNGNIIREAEIIFPGLRKFLPNNLEMSR